MGACMCEQVTLEYVSVCACVCVCVWGGGVYIYMKPEGVFLEDVGLTKSIYLVFTHMPDKSSCM